MRLEAVPRAIPAGTRPEGPATFFDKSWNKYKRSLDDHLNHTVIDRVVDVTNLNMTSAQRAVPAAVFRDVAAQFTKFVRDTPLE